VNLNDTYRSLRVGRFIRPDADIPLVAVGVYVIWEGDALAPCRNGRRCGRRRRSCVVGSSHLGGEYQRISRQPTTDPNHLVLSASNDSARYGGLMGDSSTASGACRVDVEWLW
jgi:hypothetical protein